MMFVFPADVVRYIERALEEKLMTMRQEAKAGLELWKQMGQMGNSQMKQHFT